jgi:hypothetical protein
MLTLYNSESETGLKRALGKRDRPVFQVTPVAVVVYILYYIIVAEIYHSLLHADELPCVEHDLLIRGPYYNILQHYKLG